MFSRVQPILDQFNLYFCVIRILLVNGFAIETFDIGSLGTVANSVEPNVSHHLKDLILTFAILHLNKIFSSLLFAFGVF